MFACLGYIGRGERRVWDKRVDNEPVVNAFLFVARYNDGTSIEIAINPEFGTEGSGHASRSPLKRTIETNSTCEIHGVSP